MTNEVLDQFTKLIPLLIPLILIQLGLLIAALIDLSKRENIRGPKWMWVLVILFINIIGPIVYFILGREEE